MKKHAWFWFTLLVAVIALVASAVLFVDYVRPAPVFCESGGCSEVRATALAAPLGVPLPAVGLAGILAIALAALVPGGRARAAQAALAIAGAVFGLGLIGVQVAIGALCPYCMVIDASSVVLAVLAMARWRRGWDPPDHGGLILASALGLLAAVAVPIAVGFASRGLGARPGAAPEPIAAILRQTPPGKVTIVDFVDYECPFCRLTHEQLMPVLERHAGEVRLVRKQVPLRMHPNAMDAAKASVCADELGHGDAMADALFGASSGELGPEGCERIAQALGLDIERFRACVRAPATEAKIEQDRKDFRESGGHGLPTIWVDGVKLEGAQSEAALEAAIDAARRAR